MELGLVISIVGAAVTLYYLIKIVKIFYNMMLNPEGRWQTLKSFFTCIPNNRIWNYINSHDDTLLGAIQLGDGMISIEPTSRNLIILGPQRK